MAFQGTAIRTSTLIASLSLDAMDEAMAVEASATRDTGERVQMLMGQGLLLFAHLLARLLTDRRRNLLEDKGWLKKGAARSREALAAANVADRRARGC